ncbi:hypothetical protein FKM82_020688 [Ascaphus truei]
MSSLGVGNPTKFPHLHWSLASSALSDATCRVLTTPPLTSGSNQQGRQDTQDVSEWQLTPADPTIIPSVSLSSVSILTSSVR